VKQVKEVEEVAQAMIGTDVPVYARETKLGVAKGIQGLRAVFDETYPDPVRVVSIGVPIEQLEGDPTGPAGLETSVEFCGGTHLLRSGHIGDFVISSEEAIAKGIRRIIALTGPDATKSLKKAALLEQEVLNLKNLVAASKGANTKEIVKKIVGLEMNDISPSNIPYWKKDDLRNALKELKKSLDDLDRAAKAEVLIQVVEETKKLLTETPPPEPYLVRVLNAYSNTKALDAALKQVKTLSPSTSALFLTVDQDAGKLFCLSNVSSDGITKGLKANEWVGKVAEIIGGKGGGKAESAQGSGNKVNAIDEAVKVAIEFAKLKLL